MSVDPSQRHTKANRCPVCDGADGDPRGKGHRCGGFTSGDYVHCSREELAGGIAANNAGLFAHYMHGACKCGQSHGAVRPTKEIVATYDYTDESGALLFQVVRFAPKDFRQRTPDGAGGWTWSTSGVARVPYRLQAIVEDDADRTVYIVEGEKDVETLEQLGYLATCNPGGAGKWGAIVDSARRVLADRDVVIVADRDDVGRKHAASVEASLTGIARSIRVLECPSRKDVSDHIENGGRIEDLVPMGSVVDLFSKEEQAFRLRWPRLTATDLSAPLAPVPWVCEALGMAPGAVTIVGGAGFGGKTVSMQAFLLAVASGSKAWGFYDVAQGRAVHIDYEQDRPLTQLRYQRIARTMGIDIRSLEGRLEAYCLPTARLDDEKAYDELVRILDGARIAIVDAFRGAFPSAKENDSGVRHFLDMLQRASRATGCMIVVIAHSRKLNDDVDIRSSLRGSGALFDASQTVYMLDGSPKKMTRVTNTKDRWLGETRETFGLRIRDEMSADPSITDRRWGLAVEYAAPCEVQAEYIASEANDDITIAMNAARLTTIGARVLSIIGSAPDGIMLSTLKGITAGIGSAIDLSAVTHDLVAQGHVDVDGRGPSSIYRRRERSISVIPTATATPTTTTTATPTATPTATTTATATPTPTTTTTATTTATSTADIEGDGSQPRSEHPATRGGGRDPSA